MTAAEHGDLANKSDPAPCQVTELDARVWS